MNLHQQVEEGLASALAALLVAAEDPQAKGQAMWEVERVGALVTELAASKKAILNHRVEFYQTHLPKCDDPFGQLADLIQIIKASIKALVYQGSYKDRQLRVLSDLVITYGQNWGKHT